MHAWGGMPHSSKPSSPRPLSQGAKLDEVAISDKLLGFRRQQPGFIEPSFPTIAGADANGAIIHYRPVLGENNKTVKQASAGRATSRMAWAGHAGQFLTPPHESLCPRTRCCWWTQAGSTTAARQT